MGGARGPVLVPPAAHGATLRLGGGSGGGIGGDGGGFRGGGRFGGCSDVFVGGTRIHEFEAFKFPSIGVTAMLGQDMFVDIQLQIKCN